MAGMLPSRVNTLRLLAARLSFSVIGSIVVLPACGRPRPVLVGGQTERVMGEKPAPPAPEAEDDDSDISDAAIAELRESPSSSEVVVEPGQDEFDALNRVYHGSAASRSFFGKASYYSDKLRGRSMANGEPYHPHRPVAAHRKLPFGTVVRVVSLTTKRSVIVRITDRGPFVGRGRVIDLSRRAAEALHMLDAGVIHVRVEVLSLPRARP